MKWLHPILCGLLAVAFASSYTMSYLEGRIGEFWPFPFQLLAILGALMYAVVGVTLLIVALVRKRPFGPTAAAVGFSIVLLVISGMVAPAKIFQVGFRDRIQSTISVPELRELGRYCAENVSVEKPLPSPGKWSLWEESEHRAPWEALMRATAVGKLDPGLTIYRSADSVEITWGGALVGHWGVTIQTSGKMKPGDIAEGITTGISSN